MGEAGGEIRCQDLLSHAFPWPHGAELSAMLSHLVRGFDPRYIGAYLDPCHLVIEGEEFELGAAIMKDYLCILGLKDALLAREEKHGHGAVAIKWVEAGQGMVNWTGVFSELVRIAFDGPMSIHCEFEIPEDGYMAALRREVAFFNRVRDAADRRRIAD